MLFGLLNLVVVGLSFLWLSLSLLFSFRSIIIICRKFLDEFIQSILVRNLSGFLLFLLLWLDLRLDFLFLLGRSLRFDDLDCLHRNFVKHIGQLLFVSLFGLLLVLFTRNVHPVLVQRFFEHDICTSHYLSDWRYLNELAFALALFVLFCLVPQLLIVFNYLLNGWPNSVWIFVAQSFEHLDFRVRTFYRFFVGFLRVLDFCLLFMGFRPTRRFWIFTLFIIVASIVWTLVVTGLIIDQDLGKKIDIISISALWTVVWSQIVNYFLLRGMFFKLRRSWRDDLLIWAFFELYQMVSRVHRAAAIVYVLLILNFFFNRLCFRMVCLPLISLRIVCMRIE